MAVHSRRVEGAKLTETLVGETLCMNRWMYWFRRGLMVAAKLCEAKEGLK